MKVIVRGIELNLYDGSGMLDYYAAHCSQIEPEVFDFIDSLDPSIDTFLDLGACEGRYTVYASKKGIKTVAFEPESKNFESLLTNIQMNDITTATLHNAATGRYCHLSKLVIGQDTAGGHQKVVLDATGRSSFRTKENRQKITVVSLDSLNLSATAIKIDVDGSELETLEGGLNTITTCRQLIIELQDNDRNYVKCRALLNSWGLVLKNVYPITFPWKEPHLANYWFTNPRPGSREVV